MGVAISLSLYLSKTTGNPKGVVYHLTVVLTLMQRAKHYCLWHDATSNAISWTLPLDSTVMAGASLGQWQPMARSQHISFT